MKKEVLLFTTQFCAKCPGVKKKLDNANVNYTVIDAIKDARAKEFNIRGVPTVITLEDDAIEDIYVGEQSIVVNYIKEWLEE